MAASTASGRVAVPSAAAVATAIAAGGVTGDEEVAVLVTLADTVVAAAGAGTAAVLGVVGSVLRVVDGVIGASGLSPLADGALRWKGTRPTAASTGDVGEDSGAVGDTGTVLVARMLGASDDAVGALDTSVWAAEGFTGADVVVVVVVVADAGASSVAGFGARMQRTLRRSGPTPHSRHRPSTESSRNSFARC